MDDDESWSDEIKKHNIEYDDYWRISFLTVRRVSE